MTDLIGNELNIDDYVVYATSHLDVSIMRLGIVSSFKENNVVLKDVIYLRKYPFNNMSQKKINISSDKIIKISKEDGEKAYLNYKFEKLNKN